MKPILFPKTETNFNTNGIGALDFIKCSITEERNGIFELQGEITSEALHSSSLEMDSIIKAKVPDQTDYQLFRVYLIRKTIKDRYAIFANHISYALSGIPTMPFSVVASSSACNQALQALKTNAAQSCNFDFYTNVDTNVNYKIDVPTSIKNAMGGAQGSILQAFGGEYKYNNFSVSLLKNRGKTAAQKDVNLMYGKDIIDLTQEENINNVITGVAPYWKNTSGILVTLPEKVIESPYASNYPIKRTVPLDCSMEFKNQPTQSQLRSYAQNYVNNINLGVPAVSIKVKFVDLTGEDANNLKKLKLCDNVGVIFLKLGINTTAKVIRYVYDVLQEEYDEISIGATASSLSGTIVDINNQISATASNANAEISEAVDWITGTNGNIIAVRGSNGNWKDLLIMDTANVSTAENIIKLNADGITFSKNGINGPYYPGFSIDGSLAATIANFIDASILNKVGSDYFKIDNLKITGGTFAGNVFTEKNEISLNQNVTALSETFKSLMLKASEALYLNANNIIISFDNGLTFEKLFEGNSLKNCILTNKSGSDYLKIDDTSITGGTFAGNVFTEKNEISLNQNVTIASDTFDSLSISAEEAIMIIAPEAFISADGVNFHKLFSGTRDGHCYINGLMLE